MKIWWLVLAVLSMSGCVTAKDSLSGCTVFTDVGGKSTPIGLIVLPPTLDTSLREQLPAAERARFVCWYTSGDRLVVSERKNPDSFVYGYAFTKQSGTWQLADSNPEILAVPRAID